MNTKITLASTAGFCFGVSRAIELIEKLLKQGKRVCTLGPIIHNEQVVNSLKAAGVVIADRLEDIPKGYTAVIRSHGIEKAVFEQIRASGIDYCDATCPFVSKIHKIVDDNSDDNTAVIIAGDENHAEVVGIRSHADADAYIVNDEKSAESAVEKIINSQKSGVLMVAQTTFDKQIWGKLKKIVKKLYTNAIFFDTICYATAMRQNEAGKLADENELMIVIGDRQSSNTRKLFNICSAKTETLLVETASLTDRDKILSAASIGVTAGASTPAGIIKEVINTMTDIMKNEETQVESTEEQTEQIEKAELNEAFEQTEAVEQKSDNTQPEQAEEAEKAEEAVTAKAADETETAEAEAKEPQAENNTEEKTVEQPSIDITDDMSFEEALEASLSNMNLNQRVKGTVIAVNPTEVQVDIGRKYTGIVPADELSNDTTLSTSDFVKVGDEIDLIVMRTNDVEGIITLSKKRFDAYAGYAAMEDAKESQAVLEGKVTAVVKGGVTVLSNGIKVFVPASQATLSRSDDLNELVGTSVKFRIIDIRRGRNVVGSIRSVLRDEKKAQKEELWKTIAVGNTYTGVVKSLTSYGAFVDIGGVDGMIHITELSWSRIKHPSEVVNVGDTVEVYVKDVDEENRKISLGFKKAEDNPWEIIKSKFAEGDTVSVKIVSFASYGAFANLIPGIDGLIHISQISNTRIEKPQDVLKAGDQVDAMITEIDYDRKRVSLSIKALLAPEVPEESEEEQSDDEERIVSTDDMENMVDIFKDDIDKASEDK